MSNSKTKRLLFITTRRFWPVDGGRQHTLYDYCRSLHDVYGYEIYLYSFLEAAQTPENGSEKPYFIHSVTYATAISLITKIKNLICKTVFAKQRFPLQCSLYYSQKNKHSIEMLVQNIEPDVIIVDMVRLAPYYSAFSKLECKKILDMDDILSKRYRRQLKNTTLSENYMGAYEGQFGSRLKKFLNCGLLKNIVLKIETNLMEQAEKYYAGSIYDSTMLVSEPEKQYLNREIGIAKAVTVPVGIDYRYLSERIDFMQIPRSLSIVANFNSSANASSLEMICRSIIPKLPIDVKFYAVGRCPDGVKESYKSDRVEFLGFVDDVRVAIKSTEIFLSPFTYGSGTKIKILEAMAMGMPIVTNSIGTEGLNVHNGKELFIAETPDEIADVVMRLLDDPVLRKKIAENAQAYVRTYHDWNVMFEAFGKMGL